MPQQDIILPDGNVRVFCEHDVAVGGRQLLEGQWIEIAPRKQAQPGDIVLARTGTSARRQFLAFGEDIEPGLIVGVAVAACTIMRR